jgi:hypothetical protein
MHACICIYITLKKEHIRIIFISVSTISMGNSDFAERKRLCQGPFFGPSAELICADRRRRHRLTHGTTIFADGRTVGTARPSARRFLCRGLALGT